MFEAAVAHHLATGKKNFLDVAVKAADLLVKTFGPGKRSTWPGHQITEMALVRLYRVTGKEDYLNLAKFFLDERGPGPDGSKPTQFPNGERANPRGLDYNQAQLKVIEQSEPVGHAVRAVYMYSGMADVAALTGDEKIRAAGKRIWDYLMTSKLYLTGGIGASGSGEAFGKPYELPNATAYNETCASVGMDFWAHRLFLLEGDAQYIDVMERTLYNGLISGVALDGKTYFYPNVSRVERSPRPQPVVRRRLLSRQHHPIHGVGARLSLCHSRRHGLREPLRQGDGRHRDSRRESESRAGHALSVGRRGEDDPDAGEEPPLRVERAHPWLGAQRAGADRPLSLHGREH